MMSNFAEYIVAGIDGTSGASLMYLFFTGLILFSFINILAVYRDNQMMHYFSFFLWFLITLFWFSMVALLYSGRATIPDLCINHRCPDSFWLNDWYWNSFPMRNSSLNETNFENSYLVNNSTSSSSRQEADFWYSLGSLLICFSFLLYLALLGSLVWNHCSAVCAARRAGGQTPVGPGGYLYVVELRRRSTIDESNNPATSAVQNPQRNQDNQTVSPTGQNQQKISANKIDTQNGPKTTIAKNSG
ncbi:uncharacterized protein LOC128983658 [Macrosteles quadrilineatus]|uniref:uncharacterized protein LOC128983658 n=1 Tax=Macrosteles quadrilineatus TaxID=74068 RepID=UPI0023E25D29|nr:uncharacterized protein LOC128983658 [Macrosteles quadrilineatus]